MPKHFRSARPSPCQTRPQRRTIGRSLSARGSPETSSAHDHRRARKLLSAQPSAEAGACADLQEPLQRTSVARPDTSSTQNHRQKPERARTSRKLLSARPSPGQTPAHDQRHKPERARTSRKLRSARASPSQTPAHDHRHKPERARISSIARTLSARGCPDTSAAHDHRHTRHRRSVEP